MQRSIRTISPLPFLIGVLLWTGATALLLEDVWRGGNLTVTHCLMPILTLGTVAAAIFVHRSLASLRLISGAGFLLLASLGIAATVYGTMGRQADARDQRLGEAQRLQGRRAAKLHELEGAKRSQAAECVRIGPRCQQWNARVDQLTAEVGQLPVVAVDPRADAVVRLAVLFGLPGPTVRGVIEALEPVLLPLFLELGSIVFFAAAFPAGRNARNRQQLREVAGDRSETVDSFPAAASLVPASAYTREQALRDFRGMREVGAQRFLRARWGVDKSTVSRWLKDWETEGLVKRGREGRAKPALALPLPRKQFAPTASA
jgi:hypothetical protein